jgi:hypothetical protein
MNDIASVRHPHVIRDRRYAGNSARYEITFAPRRELARGSSLAHCQNLMRYQGWTTFVTCSRSGDVRQKPIHRYGISGCGLWPRWNLAMGSE